MKPTLTAAALILSASTAVAGGLTDPQHAAALAALDDEYKAWTVYEVVMSEFGRVKPFSNIQRAESQHIAALSAVLSAEGYEVPANPYVSGEKPKPVAPGSLAEACAIGVEAEIANAALYDDTLLPAVAGHAELTRVFTNLRDASENNHLPAFRRCAK
jgi:predicted nucleic acid-binding protein